jgi:hypothetical protein
MIVLHLDALAAIAAALSVLMAAARILQYRTGDSAWVGIPPKMFIFLRNPGLAFVPLPPRKGVVT